MVSTAKEHRIAILLKSLGAELTNGVLGQIPSERASSVSSALQALDADPPTDDEVTDVLEEFPQYRPEIRINHAAV